MVSRGAGDVQASPVGVPKTGTTLGPRTWVAKGPRYWTPARALFSALRAGPALSELHHHRYENNYASDPRTEAGPLKWDQTATRVQMPKAILALGDRSWRRKLTTPPPTKTEPAAPQRGAKQLAMEAPRRQLVAGDLEPHLVAVVQPASKALLQRKRANWPHHLQGVCTKQHAAACLVTQQRT